MDTREQRPLKFSDAVDVEIVTLETGDYSVAGFSDRIRIERKAMGDLWQCVGRERERFEAELARLARYEHRAVIIEATIDEILMTAPRGRVKPATVVRSTIAWQQDYGVPFVWAGSPQNASAWVERALTRLPRKAANKARSEKAKEQHAVSNPRAGESSGLPSSEGTPKRGSATAAALAREAGVSRPTMEASS